MKSIYLFSILIIFLVGCDSESNITESDTLNYFPLVDGDVQNYKFKQIDQYQNELKTDSCDVIWNIESQGDIDGITISRVTQIISGVSTEQIYNDGAGVWETVGIHQIDTTLSFNIRESSNLIQFEQPIVYVGPIFWGLEFEHLRSLGEETQVKLSGVLDEYLTYEITLEKEIGIVDLVISYEPGHHKRFYYLTRVGY